MKGSDEELCNECSGPAERGAISWSGDPIFWNQGERTHPRQNRAEELLIGPISRFDHPEVAALRCPACRTVWFKY